MDRLQEEVSELQQAVRTIGEAMVEHKIRLENGTKAFAKMDEQLDEMEKRTMPNPPSVLKIVCSTFGCFVVIATALWGLSAKLSDRPTTSQVKEIMLDHDRYGHEELRKEMSSVQASIGVQEALIKDVAKRQDMLHEAQKQTGEKIDRLLQRPVR